MPLLPSPALRVSLLFSLLIGCPSTRRADLPAEGDGPDYLSDAGPDLLSEVRSLPDLCTRRAQYECSRLATCCGIDPPRADVCSTWQLTPYSSPLSKEPFCGAVEPLPPGASLTLASQCLRHTPDRDDGCRLRRADDPKRARADQLCAQVVPPRLLPANSECPYGDPAGQQCESPSGTYSTCSPCYDGCIGKCTTPRAQQAADQRCSRDYECAPPHRCRSNSERMRVCRLPTADGQPCAQDDDCASGACTREANATELGRCSADGTAVSEQSCDQLREVARHALFEASWPFWVTERRLVWWDINQLVVTDKADTDGERARSNIPLPFGLNLNNTFNAVDDARLVVLDPLAGLLEVAFDEPRTRNIAVDFKPAALALHDATLWLASAECQQVRQLAAQDVLLTSATRADRAPGNGDAGVPLANTVRLAADTNGALCAAGADLWHVEAGGSSVEHVARLSGHGGTLWVSSVQQTPDAWIVFATDSQPGKAAAYTLSKADGTLTDMTLSQDFPERLLSQAHVDRFNGAVYANLADGVMAASASESVELPLFGLRFQAGPVADESGLYWIASNLMFRREKPAL